MLNGYRTIIASAIAILAALMSMFGIDFSIGDQQALGNNLAQLIGGGLAIYFRIKASKNLSDPTTVELK